MPEDNKRKNLHLHLVNPMGVVFDKDVDSVTLPGKDGQLTVLRGHVSLLTSLKKGTIFYKEKTDREKEIVEHFNIGAGLAEVSENLITVIVSDKN